MARNIGGFERVVTMFHRVQSISRIALVSPPPIGVGTETEMLSCIRFGTPEYCLALLGSILRQSFPAAEILAISGRRLARSETPAVERKLYGDLSLCIASFPLAEKCIVETACECDVALISATFTQEAAICCRIISAIRERNPSLTVIVGGTDAMFRSQTYLRAGADIVVTGEAETVLPDLVKELSNGREHPTYQIVGRAFRIEESPCIVSASNASRCSTGLSLTFEPSPEFAKVLFGDELHEGKPPNGVSEHSAYFETSRGCRPGNCGFCSCGPKTGGAAGYRVIAPHRLKTQLESISGAGVNTLQIIDDNFLAREDISESGSGLFEVLEIMRGLGFAWEFANGLQMSRLLKDGMPRQDLIDALFNPCISPSGWLIGGYRAFLSFETALRPRPPRDYRRWPKMNGVGIEEAIALLESFDKAGVQMLSLGVMIGFPDDTMRDIEETVEGMKVVEKTIRSLNRQRYAQGLALMEIHWDVVIYMLLPGTRDFQRYRHRILFGDDYNTAPELLNFQTAAYWPDNFTPWELTEIRAEIAREFNAVNVLDGSSGSTRHVYTAHG